MKKDEKYIKELLKTVFKDSGKFQQFEFSQGSGSLRPDFVILGDKYFKYFEIKSEFDTFDRLVYQFNDGLGLFTHLYLVIPESKFQNFIEYSGGRVGDVGVFLLEDLEQGKTKPRIEQNYINTVSIDRVANILWKEELFHYVNIINPEVICVDRFDGKKLNIKTMTMYELNIYFKLFYSNKDSLRILNEVIPARHFGYRLQREQQKQLKLT